MTRWRADGLLLLTALIFGLAFISQKEAVGRVGPFAFVAARFLLSTLVLAPFALWESRRTPRAMTVRDRWLALSIGAAMAAGSLLQQMGMMTASATNGGFLTALYVVLTPFVVWTLTGRRPSRLVFVACGISIFGAWALATNGRAIALVRGDAELLAADLAWAAVIALTSIFLDRVQRPFTLAFTQYAVSFAVGLFCALAFESTTLTGLWAASMPIAYAGVVAGGIGFTIQLLALGKTPPSEAALILSLEGVFGALAGAWIFAERLSSFAMMGCGLILWGVLIVELGPTVVALRRLRGN